MFSDIGSESATLLFRSVVRPLALKEGCFDYGKHCLTIRLRRIDVQHTDQDALMRRIPSGVYAAAISVAALDNRSIDMYIKAYI
jgi:hypothetical protein